MRRLSLMFAMCLLGTLMCVSVLPADSKDTPLAEKTRTVKLKTKITLEIKNEMMREVLKEISGALEDKKVGSLSFKNDNGVNMNARVTVSAKDKPVEEILDEMFKPLNYGYYIVSKAGDREDGFIRINTSPGDRGSKGDEMSKSPAKKEDETKKKEEVKKTETKKKESPDKEEIAAKNKLNLAENYLASKNNAKAKSILEDLIKMYPNTKAAKDAQAILEKLNK